MTDTLLNVEHLKTHFFTEEGVVKAVDDVSFAIGRGKTLGLVGESGCGKSVTAMSILRLISPPGRIVAGRILLSSGGKGNGSQAAPPTDLTTQSEYQLRKVRGGKIAMIFQEPMTSLNPVFTVGQQIREAILLHQHVSKDEAHAKAIEALRKVRIAEPERRVREYPHQFSGGMRQRVMIAMALACNPQLLIADEPTTALDVTIQAQILELLKEIQQSTGMSILIITHDLGIIAEMADDVAVMYSAKVVEQAPVAELFANPLHPYTRGLFRAIPRLGASKHQKLDTIDGAVPNPLHLPSGCTFRPRCEFAQQRCEQEEPQLREIRPGHWARCHFAEEIAHG